MIIFGFVDPAEYSGLAIFKVVTGKDPELLYSEFMADSYDHPRQTRKKILRWIKKAEEELGVKIDWLVVEDQYSGPNIAGAFKVFRRSIEFEEAAYRYKIKKVSRIMPSVWQSRLWKDYEKPKKDKKTKKPSAAKLREMKKMIILSIASKLIGEKLELKIKGHIDRATAIVMGLSCLKHSTNFKVT